MKNDDTLAAASTLPKTPGMTTVGSPLGPKETMDRLAAEIRQHGMQVFVRIDHAAGAAEAGLELPPTELIIFGNARAGTLLMQANQLVGIDLPLKALVCQDAAGSTWVTYIEPVEVARRHALGKEMEPAIERMTALLATVVAAAVSL